MGSRVLRLIAGPALAAFLLVGAATPALADATSANANAAQGQSNGKADSSNASDKAGANENAANNPHAAQPEAPAEEEAPSNDAAPSSTTTSSSTTSSKATTTRSGGGCSQTPYGSGGNGANTGGVYDDTCQPKASGNGNGGGVAKGKPAAGTVGKADEKNPPGQQPGPNDKNNGYECDGNKGIARTNPAHTGCRTTTPPCVPTTENPCEEPGCVPTAEDDCLPDCIPTVEDPCEPPCVPTDKDPCTKPVCVPTAEDDCTEVEGEVITRTPPGGTKVLGAVFTRGALARTGGSVLDLTLVGSVLVAAGFVLARMSRRGAFEA